MQFKVTITNVRIEKSGHIVFVADLGAEMVEDSDIYESVSGWPGQVKLPISAVSEIVLDNETWPTRQEKLIELRDRILAAIAVDPSVGRTIRLYALLEALPDLPYETFFEVSRQS